MSTELDELRAENARLSRAAVVACGVAGSVVRADVQRRTGRKLDEFALAVLLLKVRDASPDLCVRAGETILDALMRIDQLSRPRGG